MIDMQYCSDCEAETRLNKERRCMMCGGGNTYRKITVAARQFGHSERIRQINARLRGEIIENHSTK